MNDMLVAPDVGRRDAAPHTDARDFIQDPVRFSRERGIDERVLLRSYLAKLEAKLGSAIGEAPAYGRLATLPPPSVREIDYPAREDIETTRPHMGPIVALAAVVAGAAVVQAAAAVVTALVALGVLTPPKPKPS